MIPPILAGALPAAAAVADTPPLVLAGGTIIDVSGRSTDDISDGVVVIQGGEIVDAGPQSRVAVPAGARVVRIDGAYVLPGLSDVFAGMNSQAQANAYLCMGRHFDRGIRRAGRPAWRPVECGPALAATLAPGQAEGRTQR